MPFVREILVDGSTLVPRTGRLNFIGAVTNYNNDLGTQDITLGGSGLATTRAVRNATTAALAACTYAAGSDATDPGRDATLTANALVALGAIDGVTNVAGERILVKNQVAQLQNGVWVVTNAGSAGTTAWILTRATDFDSDNEVRDGVPIAVGEGTSQAGEVWRQTANNPIDVGTDAITFARESDMCTLTTTQTISGAKTFTSTAGLIITQAAAATSSPTALTVTPGAHTACTASTESIGANFNMSASKQWATGALATQREVLIQAPTYTAVGASVFTDSATLAIDNSPQAGANVTLTNSYSIWIQAGISRFDGNVSLGANVDLSCAAGTTAVDLSNATGTFQTGTGQHTLGGNVTVTQPVATTGSPNALLVTAGAHTTLAAGTECSSVDVDASATKQFATGAIATQREVLIQAPTYAFVGASIVTAAATLAVSGAPIAGANATLTASHALWIQGGNAQFDGNVTQSGATTFGTGTGAVSLNGNTTVTQPAGTSGVPTALTVTGGAHTTMTASTEDVGVDLDLSATKQWATGALATQREVLLQAPTYAFVGASIVTTAATLAVSGAPIAGANATLTSTHAIWIQGGNAQFDGNITQSGATTFGTGTGAVSLNGNTTLTQPAAATGVPTALTVTGGAHTTMTASTEDVGVDLDLSATKQWATGAIATQREVLLQAPTYAFVGASVVTDCATLAISNAPQAGANATLTNAYSLWCQAGTSRFDGHVSLGANVNLSCAAGSTAVDLSNATGTFQTGTGQHTLGGNVTITQPVATTGSPNALLVTAGAHTTLTASTECSGVNINASATKQWATGAIATQREVLFQAPTYAFVGASVVTNAATVAISAAPIAGANATLTASHALWVQAGMTTLAGGTTTTTLTASTSVITPLIDTATAVTLNLGNPAAPVLAGTHVRQAVIAGGTPTTLTVTAGAHTTCVASTECSTLNINASASKQWATGALATQRECVFQAPTWTAVGASVFTDGATVAISGAPTAGANMTITNSHSLWCQAGNAQFDGGVGVTGNIACSGTVDGVDVSKLATQLWSMPVLGAWAVDGDGVETNGAGLCGTTPTITNQAATFCKVWDNSAAGYQNLATSSSGAGYTANWQLFPDVAAPIQDNDAVYFCGAVPFCELSIDMGGVVQASAGNVFTWEYADSATPTWSALTIAFDNTSAAATTGARSFERDGAISFVPPSDWTSATVDGQAGYWIRCRVSTVANYGANAGVTNAEEHGLVTPTDGFQAPVAGTITAINLHDGATTLHTTQDVIFILHNFTTGASSGALTFAQDVRCDRWTGLSIAVAANDVLGVVCTQEDTAAEPSGVMLNLTVTV
jgi:hypothetical protein